MLVFDAHVDMPDEHISIKTLAYLTVGIWQPTLVELEQMVEHTVACTCCQKILETFLLVSRDDDQIAKDSGVMKSCLLSQIAQLMREIDIQDDISAYVEILEIQGQEEADQQLPVLAEHLKKCYACQLLLEQAQTLLRRAESVGLIAPLV